MLTAEDVLHTRFAATKFRDGYDQSEVDDFLDRVVRTLRARETGTPTDDPVTVQAVRDVRFQATRFREGYDQEQVDDLLDRVGKTLQAVADAPSAARVVTDAPPPPPPASTPGLVEPPRGWLARLLGR